MAASVPRSAAQAARLSRRSVNSKAAPAAASAIAVVVSITTMSLPERLRRARPIEASARHRRPTWCCLLSALRIGHFHLASILELRSTAINQVLQERSGRGARLWKPRVGVLLASFACCLCATLSHAAVFSADAVKAAFLYRFASYVEWPPDAPPGPFVIAVAGDEEVASQLDALQPRMSVNGRPVRVRRVTRASELDGVHILYVGPGPMTRTRALRTAAVSRPILLVTDDQDGIDAGG